MNRYQKEYIHRINRVIDYIDANLDKELSIKLLSDVAMFSPYHFHRIFSAFVGETIVDFVRRRRVEKAASILINNPDATISGAAYHCGFNNVPVFCRNTGCLDLDRRCDHLYGDALYGAQGNTIG